MKNKTLKIAVTGFIACAVISSSAIFPSKINDAAAEGKVAVTPYIQYTFDSADTMLENSGSSASDKTKNYNLNLLGNATPDNMCYLGDVELKDNSALYLEGANNPFANGDLTDYTVALDVTLRYSSWYASVVSWDGVKGNPDKGENGSYAGHRYSRVTVASNKNDADWLRFTDNQTGVDSNGNSVVNKEHWSSYYKGYGGQTLYTGDRTVSETTSVTLIISVDKDGKMVAKSYVGVNEEHSVSVNLPSGWDIYSEADANQKRFTLGGAYDSREGQHLQMKLNGRMDNVRIYDFAMTEEQMAEYAASEERQIFVDGVEVDTNLVGGTVKVSNTMPEIGEKVTITPIPDDNAELVEVTVDGVKIEPVDGVYTATMKKGGIFVSAKFIRSYAVGVDSEMVNGTVTADKTVAKEGEKVTFTVTPDSGYKVRNVYVNGATVEEINGEYSFVMQSEAITVSAEFGKWVTVTVKDGIKGGSASANKSECWEGDSVIVTVKADEGYEVKKVAVNGQEIEKTGVFYKFSATDNSVIEVEFSKIGGGCGGSIAGVSCATAFALAAALIIKKKRK